MLGTIDPQGGFGVGYVVPYKGRSVAKGYWVSVYRTISDPEKLAACDGLAVLSDSVERDFRIVEGLD